MRIPNTANPFPTVFMPGLFDIAACPARWIWHPDAKLGEPAVLAFRLPFSVAADTRVRFHVSADQRYELYLDGARLGRGPERGDPAHWFFETYEEELSAGQHFLAARAWWLPRDGAPMAQMSTQPGFLLYAEGEIGPALTTGQAPWEVLAIDAYQGEPVRLPTYYVVGWSFALDGARFPWGWESDPRAPGAWVPASGTRFPFGGASNPYYGFETNDRRPDPYLQPAIRPPMMERACHSGAVRHAERGGGQPFESVALASRHDAALASQAEQLLHGKGTLPLKPGESIRLVIDLGNYYCAYPELVTSGGAGGQVSLGWAESLFEEAEPRSFVKGDRAQVAGKYFRGPADRFLLEGGRERCYDTLWWRAGRYVELIASAAQAPLVLESLRWRETRYPLEMESAFEASDPALAAAVPMMFRSLQMCSHETYMDCPYYEQLMYVGDTRLEVLVTYLTTSDTRLPIAANALFGWSRSPDGLTKSRYPSAVPQVIPPFSLWWVSMVHDFYLWRNRPDLVRAWLPGVDATLAAFQSYLSDKNLVSAVKGWDFCDWVPGWDAGWPPDAKEGASALINLQYLYALERAADMHQHFDEPGLTLHWRTIAEKLRYALVDTYWNEARGLLADDATQTRFSEHVQALAILTSLLSGERRARLIQGLINDPDLARTTIYFTHYLFEAYRESGAIDQLLKRFSFWRELAAQGFMTTIESPEPSRSDCHAWGAHPIYHYYATLLGARPAEPGFKAVRIAPQLGSLTWLRGNFPHPGGEMIGFDLRVEQGALLRGEITLPAGVPGTLAWQGETKALLPGRNLLG